jgi:hypothetical protein
VARFKVGDRVFGTGDMTRDGCWADAPRRAMVSRPRALRKAGGRSTCGLLTLWGDTSRREDISSRPSVETRRRYGSTSAIRSKKIVALSNGIHGADRPPSGGSFKPGPRKRPLIAALSGSHIKAPALPGDNYNGVIVTGSNSRASTQIHTGEAIALGCKRLILFSLAIGRMNMPQ